MASSIGCDAPSAGTSYPFTLGDTFLSERPSHSYCSLRYDFKPASAGRFRQGSFNLQENQAVVNLPDAAAAGADMSFAGRYEQSKDGLDCVAIFDGVSWRLELVQSLVKGLRATRRAGRVPTPPPPAMQPDDVAVADMVNDVAEDDMADDLVAALEEEEGPGAPPQEASPHAEQPQGGATAQLASDVAAAAEDGGESDEEAAEEVGGEKLIGRAPERAQPSPKPKGPRAMAAGDMSEMEREFMRAPDESEEESDDDEEALNQCSDDDSGSELAPEDF